MDAIREQMIALLTVALKTSDALLRSGHSEFWCFAVAVRSDGTNVCLVSNEADFVPILAAQPQITDNIGPAVVAVGPSMNTENLALNRIDDNEVDSGHDTLVERLRELAEAEEIVASAIVSLSNECYESDRTETVVEVELEHQSGWALIYGQPYHYEQGQVKFGTIQQFDHSPEVFD